MMLLYKSPFFARKKERKYTSLFFYLPFFFLAAPFMCKQKVSVFLLPSLSPDWCFHLLI